MKCFTKIAVLSCLAAYGCDGGFHPPPSSPPALDAGVSSAPVASVLDGYLREKAVQNAFECQCYGSDIEIDDCLADAQASAELRACLLWAISPEAAKSGESLACMTGVMRQESDCLTRAVSCDGAEAEACERASVAQQYRCPDIPSAVVPAWIDCRDKFDPNFAGPDD